MWLGQGLIEDRDTDGHVDLIAAFTAPGEALLQTVEPENPNYDHCYENRRRLEAAGIEVLELPYLPYAEVAGEIVAASYLNLYICNGAVIVPVAGADSDADALRIIAGAYPGPRDRSPCPAPCSPTAAAARTASPSRYREIRGGPVADRPALLTAYPPPASPARTRPRERAPLRVGAGAGALAPRPRRARARARRRDPAGRRRGGASSCACRS